jgi:hypothetical protein
MLPVPGDQILVVGQEKIEIGGNQSGGWGENIGIAQGDPQKITSAADPFGRIRAETQTAGITYDKVRIEFFYLIPDTLFTNPYRAVISVVIRPVPCIQVIQMLIGVIFQDLGPGRLQSEHHVADHIILPSPIASDMEHPGILDRLRKGGVWIEPLLKKQLQAHRK